MTRLSVFIGVVAMTLAASSSSMAGVREKHQVAGSAAVASGQSSSFAPSSEAGLRSAVFVAPSVADHLFLTATTDDDGHNPPPRSTHCPPDKDDHQNFSYRDDDNKNNGDPNPDKDKDKDHHKDCGKGDDGKNP